MVQVPSVACNDKDNTDSDEEYKSLEQPPVTTSRVSAGVPPKHASPSTAVPDERHQENRGRQFQKSVRGSNNQISGQRIKLESHIEKLQLHLIEVKAVKDAALQEQERFANEVACLEDKKKAEARRVPAAAAKDQSEAERECAPLTRECESLRDQELQVTNV